MSMVTSYQMPTSEYSFLSETQREYLNNPDDFDSQRSAELSYRIRQKTSEVVTDIELLRNTAPVWETFDIEPQSATLHCLFSVEDAGPEEFNCDASEEIEYSVVYSESLNERIDLPVEGWVNTPRERLGMETTGEVYAACEDCYQQAKEWYQQHQTMPCGRAGHRTHEPHSNPYGSCKAYLPVPNTEVNHPNDLLDQ